jgi:hypothetical protein
MNRDKFLIVQKPVFVNTATGGSRSTWLVHWTGWGQVKELNYSTGLEQSQIVGSKAIKFTIRKFPITSVINTNDKIIYHNKEYIIDSISEIDRFNYEMIAIHKERNNE